VGTMLYEMLTGRRPVEGDDPRQIASRVMANGAQPVRALDPTIPEGLAQIIHRAMAPVATQRYGSASEMREALAPYCGSLSLGGRLAATPAPPGATPPESATPGAVGGTTARTSSDTQPDDGGVPPSMVAPRSAPVPPGGFDPRGTAPPVHQVGPKTQAAFEAYRQATPPGRGGGGPVGARGHRGGRRSGGAWIGRLFGSGAHRAAGRRAGGGPCGPSRSNRTHRPGSRCAAQHGHRAEAGASTSSAASARRGHEGRRRPARAGMASVSVPDPFGVAAASLVLPAVFTAGIPRFRADPGEVAHGRPRWR